jgi:L-threonylcarbamoyladenylate synthase
LKTRVFDLVQSSDGLDEAAAVIRCGGLVAIPTETVYGLAADATNAEAVRRIYEAKGRPATNPLIVHVADLDGARRCVSDWPEAADCLARAFWPGPLTLVLPRSGLIPDAVTAGLDTVGLRIPELRITQDLIRRAGVPLAAPSANRSNRVSPTTAAHVLEQLDGLIDLVLDTGPTRLGLESTIVELAHGPPYRVLRPGPISLQEIRDRAGLLVESFEVRAELGQPALSPGQLPQHYAPIIPAFRFEAGDMPAEKVIEGPLALLCFGPSPMEIPWVDRGGLRETFERPVEAARELYSTLHRCGVAGVAAILIQMPPDLPEWRAVRDRLTRATLPVSSIR